jgi:hypothetical protein
LIVPRRSLAPGLLALTLVSTFGVAVAAPEPKPAAPEQSIRQLERSWARLDQEIRLLDHLLPPTPPVAGSPGTPAGMTPHETISKRHWPAQRPERDSRRMGDGIGDDCWTPPQASAEPDRRRRLDRTGL